MNQHTGSDIYKITNRLYDIPKHLRPKGRYVYFHRRATDNSIFYVGKGLGARAWRLYNRCLHHHNCSVKNGVTVEIYKDKLTNKQACELEQKIIAEIGLENLVNASDGGESGAIGITPHNITPVVNDKGMEFRSATDAAKWLNKNGYPKASGSMITACCRQRIKSAYGYDWKVIGDKRELNYVSREERISKAQGYKVKRSDGMIFRSTAEAGLFIQKEGLSKSTGAFVTIARACREGNSAYGFKWQYIKKAQ